MKISMIGTGYVGLTTGACLASLGHDVICLDIDLKKIENLNKGIMPIYEPGLKELVEQNTKEKRLLFTTNLKFAVESSEVVFLAVGTPQDNDGKADLKYIFKAAEDIAKFMNGYKVIVIKSTVPIGTAEKVNDIVRRYTMYQYDVVSNPEFLREGSAIRDFTSPDRVVIGASTERAQKMMSTIYKSMERPGNPIMMVDVNSSELIKYASNAMLATRISFMNQLAPLCEKLGADIKVVAEGMGLDKRIGPRFLQAGVGYGGSCFPKDVKALSYTLREYGCNADLIEAVDAVNEQQKLYIIPKIKSLLGDLSGKTIAVWGLAFKPKTDDIREAPAIPIIKELLNQGANIKAFDPAAQEEAKKLFPTISYGANPYDVLEGSDCLVIVTEWDEFRYLDKQKMKSIMKEPNIVDGRNVYDPKEMKELGFNYSSVGRV